LKATAVEPHPGPRRAPTPDVGADRTAKRKASPEFQLTLHKELKAAFGRTEPPDVDYRGQSDRPEEGYYWKQVDFAVVLNPSGDVINVEGPPWRLGGKRRRSTLLVPDMPFLGALGLSGFLWGRSGHAVGVGRPRCDGHIGLDPEGFWRFRAFHRAVLTGTASPSIRAFLLFLDRWEPGSMQAASLMQEAAGANLAFRFQYESGFVHDCHSARQRWARLINPAGNAAGPQEPG
jgi:hypothetical protein